MATYVADYFPDKTGVWISTEYVKKLDWKTLGRLQDCLDQEAADAVAKIGARPSLTEAAKIEAGDMVLIFDSQDEGEPPLYREFWYGGTTEEYFARESERREEREKELAESEARLAQMHRDRCAESAARRDAEWRIGGFRD